VPANNILGHPSGTYFPAGADGYWVMSTPLSAGPHEIHFKAAAGPGAFLGILPGSDVSLECALGGPPHVRQV
jgi:hypothetical protein